MGAQQSRQRFLAPALGPVIYNLSIIIGGVALSPGSASGLFVGALGGTCWATCCCSTPWSADGPALPAGVPSSHPGVRRVIGMMGAVVLSLAPPQILTERTAPSECGSPMALPPRSPHQPADAGAARHVRAIARRGPAAYSSAYAAAREGVAEFRNAQPVVARHPLHHDSDLGADDRVERAAHSHGLRARRVHRQRYRPSRPILAAYSIAVPAWSAGSGGARLLCPGR